MQAVLRGSEGLGLLALQAIEGLVEDIVVPLVGDQLIVVVDDGEGVDESGAEEGVHVLWQELALVWSVLGPVGEVAHHLIGRCCMGERKAQFGYSSFIDDCSQT